jgi:hypothetical protein
VYYAAHVLGGFAAHAIIYYTTTPTVRVQFSINLLKKVASSLGSTLSRVCVGRSEKMYLRCYYYVACQ